MKSLHVFPLLILLFCNCSTDKEKHFAAGEELALQEMLLGEAMVTNVTVSGDENAYDFNVTIKSPDSGCSQYADWWEVFDMNGELLYRRILAHSHVNEQPFTRGGGPVEISKESVVYIRAHMNNLGYSTKVFKGSVTNGFVAEDLDVKFAKGLEEIEPLPETCAF